MRKPLLTALAVAVTVIACGGAAGSPAGAVPEPDPQHHRPTADPWGDPEGAASMAPYDGVTYDPPGVQPPADPDEDRAATFGLDVDTASYGIARRYVDDGYRPDPDSVRVEEWVNAFDHGYPAPGDATFAIHAAGAPTPFTDRDEILLRIGIQARDVRDRARDAAALTFVVDTSGSMEREGRLDLVKDALHRLADGLGRGDSVALVTFGDDARVILPPTRADDGWAIHEAIDTLRPGGSTNLEAGLRLGYGLARETLTENAIDRVVLASDGVANVGLVDPESILAGIREDAAAGIELVSVGVGMGNFNDVLLERLADDGDGFYAYVDTPDEARRLFTDDLTGTLQTVALDARAQVVFEPDVVASYRLVGYENRAIDDRAFTDDEVDAGAIGAGHAVTALFVVRLREDVGRQDRLATVRLRWTDPERGGADGMERDVRLSDVAHAFAATDRTFRLDAIVAATAEVLRGSPALRHTDVRDIARVAFDEELDLPATQAARDFLDLLEAMARMER